jgi:tripartite-type tricarboxylate transporter receptor subunit TctC
MLRSLDRHSHDCRPIVRKLTQIVLAALLTTAASSVTAQPYPGKPVRVVVPFPPGGGADVLIRVLAQRLTESTKQQFVVDNRAGASGLIGAVSAAKSQPDGYTLVVGTSSNFSIFPFLVRGKPYDPVNDFAPVTLVAAAPLMIATHPSVPVQQVKDLVSLAKSRPRELFYASNGAGSLSHLATELFAASAQIELGHVPYKGGTPAVTDTIAGNVSLITTAVPTLLGHVQSKRLRAIAVTGPSRTAVMPSVPTVAEGGFPNFEVVQWYGLFMPRGASADHIATINALAGSALQTREVRDVLAREGAEAGGGPPHKLNGVLTGDIAKWQKLFAIRKINID